MLKTITLDGRKFTGVSQSLTANQDAYIEGHLRLAGALEVLNDLDGVTRTKERLAADLVTQILLSGRKSYILAGCLTEDGKVWSRADADANAARFAAISDAEAKAAMQSSIVEVVIGFASARWHIGEATWRDSFFRQGRRIGRIALSGSPNFEVSGAATPSRRIN